MKYRLHRTVYLLSLIAALAVAAGPARSGTDRQHCRGVWHDGQPVGHTSGCGCRWGGILVL